MASRGAYGKGYQRGFDAGKFKGRQTAGNAIVVGLISSVVTAFVGFIVGKRKK